MNKNDVVQLTIEDLTQEGLGIGHADGLTVFVKDTVIGDAARVKIIKMKKTYAFGRLEEIISPSPFRVQPLCPSARACGGCQIQMMDYPAQLRFKQDKVKNCLMRIGGFEEKEIPMRPILGMEEEGPWHYRNKAQYPVGTDRNKEPVAGYYAGRTHSIIDSRDCLLGFEHNGQIMELILDFMKEYGISAYDETTGRGLVRHVMIRTGAGTGQIMVCLIVNGTKLPRAQVLAERLTAVPGMTGILLNSNTRQTNVIMGEETHLLWGQPYIEDRIGEIRYQISARSFFQVNPVQTQKLYRTALEFAGLTGQETVWDLYCGIGTISLFLAGQAKVVYGVETVPEAVEDAKRNAALNHIANAQFYVGKAEEVMPRKYREEHIHADVIVIDPPRKGCEETVLETMLAMQPERIVYVSCDPATLARDLKILCGGGYSLGCVQPCDMFPHTVHVETVVLMSREDT